MQIQTVLVIILAIGYGVLLILAIIFMSLLIATILQLRKLTQKLDDLLHDPGRMVKEFATGFVPALLGGLVVGAKKTWNNRDKSKGGRE